MIQLMWMKRYLTTRFNVLRCLVTMKKSLYTVLTALLALTMAGCGSKDSPMPDMVALLTRRWVVSELIVQTHAKAYPISGITSDYDDMTFNKDGSYTYLTAGDHVSLASREKAAGTWTLTDKTLTMINAEKRNFVWTINAISATTIDLAGLKVTDTQTSYTDTERNEASTAAILFALQDKRFGGSLDIAKEPEPRAYQIFLKSKAQ